MTKAKTGLPSALSKVDRDRLTVFKHLSACRIAFNTPTPHQIKVDDWSFYPSTGTILQDNHKREATKGPEAFIRIIERLYPDRTPGKGTEIIL